MTPVEHRGDARSRGLKHFVAGGVAEQVVDFLEPVEVKAENGETLALGQRGDFLVDPPVEMAAIGQRRQGIVMCEIVDMLLGLLACLQIANGHAVTRPAGKNDGPQTESDGSRRTVKMTQAGFDWQAGARQQPGARDLVRKAAFEPRANEIGSGQNGQGSETCVDGDDSFTIANQKSLDGSIGEIAHPVDFKFRAAMIADIEYDTRQCQPDNREARDRHPDRQPSGWQGRLRNADGWVG